MQASLSAASLAATLRDLHLGHETGLLHCAQPGATRSLRFQRGQVLHILSDRQDERLGEVLLRLAVIDADQLQRATEVLVRERKRLGQVLIELGILDPSRLQDALGRHIRDVFGRVLDRLEGHLVFEALDADAASTVESPPRLRTADLILEATRRIGPEEVASALGDLSRPLELRSGASMLAAELKLTPGEGFLLSRIDGGSAQVTLSLAPGDPVEAERNLLGLVCAGLATWGVARKAQPTRADDRPRVTHLPVVEGTAPATAEASRTGGRAAPEAAPAPPTPEELRREKQAELRAEIEAAYARLGRGTHFEVLGLDRGAPEAAVKDAYFQLAKRFHPDSCNDEALADLKPRAEALFIRIGQAWDVLRNAKARADYESALPRVRPVVEPPPPPVEPPPPPTPRTAALAAEAEVAKANDDIRKAEKLVTQEQFWEAIQLFESALEIASGNYPLRARLGLARCFLKNPNWVRRGEEQLNKAMAEFPNATQPHYELARLYRDRDMKARAIARLQRVLELEPGHEDAAALLAELQTGAAPDPSPAKAPGLLGRMLRRK